MGKNDLLGRSKLLTDEYAVKILVATVRGSRSAQQISEQFGIPIAACYRRIRDLELAGLIVCTERRLSQQGRRVSFYVSMVKSASLQYDNGKLRVRFSMKDEEPVQEWQDVDLGEEEDRDIDR
ncbi:MAG TPA: winged helix-turn-helix domain-containing protein [Methanomassiliicoccales archaeon]|nr:winged helix-turn-helix domain-containing protein [Methanomassiliicoccales archaeon]